MMIGVLIGTLVVIKERSLGTKEITVEEPSGEHEVYVAELNLPLIEEDTLNPILTQNKQVADVLKLIYEPLFDWNEENRLEATLASEWYEKDELTWMIKLNSLAKWHSGRAFTADDVVFTFQTILKEENHSVYRENLKNVVAIEKLSENVVQIQLIARDKEFPNQLVFPIIPRYYWEGDLVNSLKGIKAVGTGPYCYEALSGDEKVITLVANDSWWKNEAIKLEKIYLYRYDTYGEAIKAFKSSEIDVITTTMSSWQKKFGAIGVNAYSYESAEFEMMIPNTENKILQESSVRRMLLSAINTENIIESVYQGNGELASYPIPSYSYLNFYKEEKVYDTEKAKQLLSNAGWEYHNGLWQKKIEQKMYQLEFDLLVNSDVEEKVKVANLIVENLKEIGVKSQIVKVNTHEFTKRIHSGNFELALATAYLDSDMDVLELLSSSSEKNFARYQNEEMNQIIANINEENKEEQFLKIQNLYRNESPYIGMYYKCNQLLTNQSVKGDITPTAWNAYHQIIGWCK